LADNKLLDISPQALTKPMNINIDSATMKNKYNRLSEYM